MPEDFFEGDEDVDAVKAAFEQNPHGVTAGPEMETRIVIKINKNKKMSPQKTAAQAVHAALLLLGVHHGGPVIVLMGTEKQVLDNEVVVRDTGRTEVAPGSITAGASFDEREKPKAPEGISRAELDQRLQSIRDRAATLPEGPI